MMVLQIEKFNIEFTIQGIDFCFIRDCIYLVSNEQFF